MTVDVLRRDVTPASVDDVRRRRWGVAAPVARETTEDASSTTRARGFANAAAAVEDPGEVDVAAGASLWATSSWFGAAGARVDAVVANASSVAYGADGNDARRAPGGATCQNRFIEGRGARDPFSPASERATLAVGAAQTRDDARARAGETSSERWEITRWGETGGAACGDARGATARTFRAFAGGAARRLAANAPVGGTFEFDEARKRWVIVREGEAREVVAPSTVDERESEDAMDVESEVRADALSTRDAGVVDVDDEGREMREKAREERVRLYQPSYDASSARYESAMRRRRDADAGETIRRAASAPANVAFDAVARREGEALAPTSRECSRWSSLACRDGTKVWIEIDPEVDHDAQLASWMRGDVPWPVVRTLDLGRDRVSRGIPVDAPGPVCEDADVLARVRAELERRHEANAASAPSTSGPRARAVDPSDPDAAKHANIIDTLVRATTTTSNESATDGDTETLLSAREQRALKDALKAAIREKYEAFAECDRLRAKLLELGHAVDA